MYGCSSFYHVTGDPLVFEIWKPSGGPLVTAIFEAPLQRAYSETLSAQPLLND